MTRPEDRQAGSGTISFRRLNKYFGDQHVLKDIDLEIASGEKVVICGPSGCGKSTLLRCVNRLEGHHSGELVVNGSIIPPGSGRMFHAPAGVGMVFQSFNLFPHLSVLDNCTFAPVARGMKLLQAAEIARNFLDRVHVGNQADKFPGQLSGGQQQRAAIARALCLNPKIMLLDEPTSALDPEMVKEILDIVGELAGSGMTMLMVTHEMGFARKVADRIVFMDAGLIVETSKPEIFFSSVANERSRRFVQQVLR